ncbi:N-acetyltransferase esco2 [Sorochytrium milnesiophthora]
MKARTASTTKPARFQQLRLDLGQRNRGPTTCSDCGMQYQPSSTEDRALHDQHHASVVGGLVYSPHKSDLVLLYRDPAAAAVPARRQQQQLDILGFFSAPVKDRAALVETDGSLVRDQVVVLVANSANRKRVAYLLLAVAEIARYVNSELGAVQLDDDALNNVRVYIYVTHYTTTATRLKRPKIVGCLIAEPLSTAHRLVPELDSTDGAPLARSDAAVPVCAGVSRFWVAQEARRRGIGRLLVDTMRGNFVAGEYLSLDAVAYSQPTRDGLSFFARYCNRRDILVY